MSWFRNGDSGLMYRASGASSFAFAAAPPPPPPVDGITHVLSMEYVDGSGNLQAVDAAPGDSVSISGVAPFFVWFDGSETVSEAANADTAGEAWTSLGHRFDMGEGIASSWSLTGASRNIVQGAGVMGHVFTVVGTHTFTHRVRDSEGRQSTVTLTANISAPASGTTISAGTSWPTWVSGGVYNLNAGSNYTSMGPINLSGLHNVTIRKIGEGADPIIDRINLDTRQVVSTVAQRTRGIRLIGLDVALLSGGPIGFMYVCAVGGRIRRLTASDAPDWYWLNQGSTQIEKDNFCRPRGLALWDTGELNSRTEDGYVFIGEMKNLVTRNVDMNKNGGTGGSHVFRGWFEGLDLRACRFRVASGTDFTSYNKIQGANNGSTFDPWPPGDRIGVFGGAMYLPVCRKIVLEGNVYGAAGSNNTPATNVEVMPENNDAAPAQAIERASVAGNRWFASSWVGMANSFDGRNIYYNDNRLNLGAGGETPYAFGSRTNRIPVGWNGPYVNTARPVVVP